MTAMFRSTTRLDAFETNGNQVRVSQGEWFTVEGATSTEFKVRNLNTHVVLEVPRSEFARAIERFM